MSRAGIRLAIQALVRNRRAVPIPPPRQQQAGAVEPEEEEKSPDEQAPGDDNEQEKERVFGLGPDMGMEPPAEWIAEFAEGHPFNIEGDIPFLSASLDICAIDCEAVTCFPVAGETKHRPRIGSISVVRGEPDPAALFTNVLVRPYERIKEAPRQSGLDVAEIEDCRLRPRELLSVLAERCSRETVFALHNAASDLNMMQISLWAGQVVDTAYDEDLRELAAGELESRPNVKQEHPWTDKPYSWSQYDRDATDPMKLAALVYLFTDETIQDERQPKQVAGFPRREVTKSHSSYLDAVATLGLARMALAVRGGHRGDNKAPSTSYRCCGITPRSPTKGVRSRWPMCESRGNRSWRPTS